MPLRKKRILKKVINPLNIHPVNQAGHTAANVTEAGMQIVAHPANVGGIAAKLVKKEINDKKQEINEVKEVVHDTTIIAKSTIHGAVRGYKVGVLFFPTENGIIISTAVGAVVGLGKGGIEVVKESEEEHKNSSHLTENQPHIEKDTVAIYIILNGVEGYQIGEYFYSKAKGIEILPDDSVSNVELLSEASRGNWSLRLFDAQSHHRNNNNNNDEDESSELVVKDTAGHEFSGPG